LYQPPKNKTEIKCAKNIVRYRVEREAAFFASVQMNGNRGEYDGEMTRIRLYRQRIEELQKWTKAIYPKRPMK
jgi:hypothetical protein